MSRTRILGGVVVVSLLGAGTASAIIINNGSKLKLKGPASPVPSNSHYKVKVSGKVVAPAHTLATFEGGYVSGTNKGARISCYSTFHAEDLAYPGLLSTTTVSGTFTKTYKYIAGYSGHKAFCAYLVGPITGNYGSTYAIAHAYWKNS